MWLRFSLRIIFLLKELYLFSLGFLFEKAQSKFIDKNLFWPVAKMSKIVPYERDY